MNYTLMHKNIPTLEVSLDEATGTITRVGTVYAPEHVPLGVAIKKTVVDRALLNSWWIDRCIPASRSGVKKALETLNLPNTQMLLTKCFGLSLSDQYWIKPSESALEWSNINFFDNPFSEDIGDVLLGKLVGKKNLDFQSPDNTSDGFLKKRWKIIEGKRCLIKAGSNPFVQQPFNEVIASYIAEKLNIPHVYYTLMWDEGVPYSVCEDFVTPDTELLSAWRVMQTSKKDNSTSVYQHYINCCLNLGVKNPVHAMDQMIVLDYIIANEDRHQNNFGLIRNAETLQCIGPAPIFDSGSSLGYDKLANQILSGKGVECKPFKKSHEEQLKLVSDFDWIDFSSLSDVGGKIRSVFSGAGEYVDETRQDAIVMSVETRIDQLMTLAMTQSCCVDDTKTDLEQDIAQDYTIEMDMQ